MAPARVDSESDVPASSTTIVEHDVPVLIVGAGPAGLLQARLLSRLGVRSLIIERYARRLAAPKAHALSPRSLEICRQTGIDTANVRRHGTSRKEAFHVNFLTNLSGQQVGRLPYERMDVDVLDDTPEMIHNIPQPMFEHLVADELSNDDNVTIIRESSFVACDERKSGVYTTVEDRSSGRTFLVRSRHVIACDGARSRVRQSLGIKCEGADSYEMMMTIHFSCNLRLVLGDRRGMLHWIMDPAVSGFIINYDPSGNQVLICNFDAKRHPVETWNAELCKEVLSAAIGQDVDLSVLSWRPWVLSRKVAEQYRSGNVLLAGDAAHSFPPTGGLGLNSGLGDVHNLAWKIAAVHQGWGAPSLLDSYEADRRQVALVNAQQSVKNGQKIFSFLKTLGATVDDLSEARLNLVRTINDPSQAQVIANHIEAQREHFDNLGLHIGYVYGRKTIPAHASTFTPEFVPGARLPHAWIQLLDTQYTALPPVDISYVEDLSSEDVALRRYSTLDLCAPGTFTLLTAKDSVWQDRFLSAKDACNQAIPLQMLAHGVDFEVIAGGAGDRWLSGFGLDKDGAVLVRPDQHILLLATEATTVNDFVQVLHGFLGLGL